MEGWKESYFISERFTECAGVHWLETREMEIDMREDAG